MIEARTPNWQPLKTFLGEYVTLVGYFMWMYRNGGFEYYKHVETRFYLILDGTGRPHRYGNNHSLVPMDPRDELRRVMGDRARYRPLWVAE